MFTDTTVAIYFAIGLSGWVYTKFQRRNGNNTKESVIATIAVGILTYIAIYIILGFLFGDSQPRGVLE